MLAVFIILYGAWITAVGYHGNSATAITFLAAQKSYVVWLIAVFILYMVYQVDTLKPVVKPIIFLALFALVVKNISNIETQLKQSVQEFGL